MFLFIERKSGVSGRLDLSIVDLMADEFDELSSQVESAALASNPLTEMIETIQEADPDTVEDAFKVVNEYIVQASVDDLSEPLAGLLLAMSAGSAKHLNGEIIGEWPSPDAILNESFWKAVSGASGDTWDRMVAEAIVNARTLTGTMLARATIRFRTAMTSLSESMKSDQIVEATPAPNSLMSVAVNAYGSWMYAWEKATGANPGDFVIYVTRGDEDVRSSHQSLNGFTFIFGSSISQRREVWAPNGPNCRCTNQIIRKGPATEELVPSDKVPKVNFDKKFTSDPSNHPANFARLKDMPQDVLDSVNPVPKISPKVIVVDGKVTDLGTYQADKKALTAFREEFPESKWYFSDRYDWFDDMTLDGMERVHGASSRALLNKEERLAITSYTFHYDSEFNRTLRSGQSSNTWDLNGMKVLSSGLNKMPKFKGTVYRGARMGNNFKNSYVKGVKISPKGFTSTSIDKKQATNFAGRGSQAVLFEIQSKTGVDISPISFFESEQEVLFNARTTFEVTGTRQEAGRTVVSMREL